MIIPGIAGGFDIVSLAGGDVAAQTVILDINEAEQVAYTDPSGINFYDLGVRGILVTPGIFLGGGTVDTFLYDPVTFSSPAVILAMEAGHTFNASYILSIVNDGISISGTLADFGFESSYVLYLFELTAPLTSLAVSFMLTLP